MKSQNSSLLVLPYNLEDVYFDRIKESSSDILALSLPVIQQLELLNIQHLTIGDFVSQKEFDLHLSKLSKSLSEFLINCDVESEKVYFSERLFSSNGFWFLHRLSHLSFIQMLIQELDKCYDQIEIYSKERNNINENILIDFSKLNFPIDNFVGLDGLVESLIIGLETKIIRKEVIKRKKNNEIFNEPIKDLLKRAPEIIYRRSIEILEEIFRYLYPNQKKFWSTYISYDVERLRGERYDWNVQSIMGRQINIANKCVIEDAEYSKELRNTILPLSNDFFDNWIPSFSSTFQNIIDGYITNILSRVPRVKIELSKQIINSKPRAIFFSTGIQDVLQETIATMADESNLPVYSFKHTGIEHLFFRSQYIDPYYDYNLRIKRTQFLANESELKIFDKSKKVNAIVLGNLKPKNPRKNHNSKVSNKIIYSVGQPDHSSFHFYHCLLNDYERHIWAKNLLRSIKINKLNLDVKIHPIEFSIYKKYFENLIFQEHLSPEECNLIAGGSIERILNSYDLLILDLVPTQVLSAALSMGMNIVLFKQLDHVTNVNTYKDFEDRVHIVSDFDELNDKLKLFSDGELVNKSNSMFDSKYLTSNPDIFCIID